MYLARIDELSNWGSSFARDIRTTLTDSTADMQSLVSIQQDIDVYRESKDALLRDILIPKLTQMREVVLNLFTVVFPRIEQSTSELISTIQQRIAETQFSESGTPQALLDKQTTASKLLSELLVLVPALKKQAEAIDATTNTLQLLVAQQ